MEAIQAFAGEKHWRSEVNSLINKVRSLNLRCGIAIKPATNLDEMLAFVPNIDCCLIMTVEPGFGGQSFMKDQLEKVCELRSKFPFLDIQVDGGVGLNNIDECAKAGANLIVSGTGIIKSKDIGETIRKLRESVENSTA